MNSHTLKVLEYHKIIQILASYSSSSIGKERIKNLKPLTDYSQIKQLIDETTDLKEMLHPNRAFPISGVFDISLILKKLENWSDILSIDEINQVGSSARVARVVKECLEEDNRYPSLIKIAETITVFSKLEEIIEKTINRNGEVKDSASSRLKSIRKKIQIKRKRIRDKTSSLVRSGNVGMYLQDENIRENHNRPTIAVMASHAAKVQGKQHGRSDSGKTVFIEPDSIRHLGDELEAALFDEKAEIRRLLNEITKEIAEQAPNLRNTMEVLTHLEVTYAKVRLSRNFDMHPPMLNLDGIINVRDARHPILMDLEQRGELKKTIPLDVRLGEEFHTLIVTGPNTGGKTVALKTIGLLTLMAQSGMHIPANSGSKVAVFNRVQADIGDEQSIEQSLSTFSSHLTHVSEILKSADEKSLVLLDELGGGTDPTEGEALANSILEYLHDRKARTVITTHISQLKNLAFTLEGVENASIEFDLETLHPTYRLLIGIPGQSNALALAKRLNLPETVIEKAEHYSSKDETGNLLNNLQAARSRILENRASTETALLKAKSLEQEAQQKLTELNTQLELAKYRNGEQAYGAIRQVRKQIKNILEIEPSKKILMTSLAEIMDTLSLKLDSKNKPLKKKPFQINDKVRIKSLNKTGDLCSFNDSKKTAVVSLGVMQVEVSQDDLCSDK